MPNPVGVNGGLFVPEPPYGDVKRQEGLLRSAPISGAPVTTAALEAPRRAGKRGAGKTQGGGQPAPEQMAPPVDAPAPPYGLQIAQVWQQIAATPGAEQYPLLQEYAQMAEAQANG